MCCNIFIIIAILYVIGTIGEAGEPKCIKAGCNNKQASGSSYCYLHESYNQVIQNKVHIKWIKEYLKMQNLPLYSYIIFGNNATLKSINITSRNIYIVLQRELLSAIIFNANQMGRVFTNEMID